MGAPRTCPNLEVYGCFEARNLWPAHETSCDLGSLNRRQQSLRRKSQKAAQEELRNGRLVASICPTPSPVLPVQRFDLTAGQGAPKPAPSLPGFDHPQIERRIPMDIQVRLNTGRDYAIAAVALAIIAIALMYTANSFRQ